MVPSLPRWCFITTVWAHSNGAFFLLAVPCVDTCCAFAIKSGQQDRPQVPVPHRISAACIICASQDQQPFMSAHRIYVISVPVPHRISGLLCQLTGFL